MNFREARTFVHTLGLKNKKEWYSYCKSGSKPKGLLSTPNRTYKNTGWVSWGDWLGTHTASNYVREYRSFEECREFVCALFLKGVREWHVYAKSGTRPNDIPSNPSLLYKGKGWIDWGDFLGVNIKSRNSKIFMGFDEARSFVRSLKLKNHKEWISWCKSNKRPRNIPKNPHLVYVHTGWVSWYDWLGTTKNRSPYLPFQEARKFTHSLSLNQVQEWRSYCKSGSKPRNIPSNARRTYQGKGWISWPDWLGTSTSPREREK